MDIAAWRRELGLERYEQAFRENEIDAKILLKLTADDLKDIGVTIVGHRRASCSRQLPPWSLFRQRKQNPASQPRPYPERGLRKPSGGRSRCCSATWWARLNSQRGSIPRTWGR